MSEIWVDTQITEMAPANTWQSLSINQLYDVKIQLQDKIFMAGGKKAYEVPLKRAMSELESILAWKISNPNE